MTEETTSATDTKGETEGSGTGFFVNRTLEILQSNLRNSDVPDSVRARIVGAVERYLTPMETPIVHELQRSRFQIKALRVVITVVFMLTTLVFWRVTQVEDRAKAFAYRILVERMGLMGRAGSKIQEIMMETLAEWSNKVDQDPNTPLEEKEIQKSNLLVVSEYVRSKKLMFDEIANKVDHIKIPEKIDSSTYMEDPFTGAKLPLNATAGGKLDPNAVAQMMKNEKAFIGVMLMARVGSAKGATPFKGSDPSHWALSVTNEQLQALGLKSSDLGKAGTETFIADKPKNK